MEKTIVYFRRSLENMRFSKVIGIGGADRVSKRGASGLSTGEGMRVKDSTYRLKSEEWFSFPFPFTISQFSVGKGGEKDGTRSVEEEQ